FRDQLCLWMRGLSWENQPRPIQDWRSNRDNEMTGSYKALNYKMAALRKSRSLPRILVAAYQGSRGAALSGGGKPPRRVPAEELFPTSGARRASGGSPRACLRSAAGSYRRVCPYLLQLPSNRRR